MQNGKRRGLAGLCDCVAGLDIVATRPISKDEPVQILSGTKLEEILSHQFLAEGTSS
jgi:hypothetical protein